MSTTALLNHLPHFGVAPRGPARGSTPVSAVPAAPPSRRRPPPCARTSNPAPRPSARRPGGRRVALEEASIALAACEQQLADAEAAFAARLEEEIGEARARWCAEESARLADLIGTGLDTVEARLSEALAAVLRPFVSGAARARALDELARRVRELLRGGAAGAVHHHHRLGRPRGGAIRAALGRAGHRSRGRTGERPSHHLRRQRAGNPALRLGGRRRPRQLTGARHVRQGAPRRDHHRQAPRRRGARAPFERLEVAHADFMTAMMAFFLIMWLINVTDKDTRKAIANYFNPVDLASSITDVRGLNDPEDTKAKGTSSDGDKQSSLKNTTGRETGAGDDRQQGDKERAAFRDPYAVLNKLAGDADARAGGTPDAAVGDTGSPGTGAGDERVRSIPPAERWRCRPPEGRSQSGLRPQGEKLDLDAWLGQAVKKSPFWSGYVLLKFRLPKP